MRPKILNFKTYKMRFDKKRYTRVSTKLGDKKSVTINKIKIKKSKFTFRTS